MEIISENTRTAFTNYTETGHGKDDGYFDNESPFDLSFFKRINDIQAEVKSLTWNEFCDKVKEPLVREMKDGENFSPAIFEPSFRNNDNARTFSMLCFDVDVCDAPESLLDKLRTLNSRFLVHSTYRHTKESPKYRIVLPLREKIYKNEQQRLWEMIPKILGFEVDGQTKDAGRAYFLPRVSNDGLGDYEYHIEKSDVFFDARFWLETNEAEYEKFNLGTESKRNAPIEVDISSVVYEMPEWMKKLRNILLSQPKKRERDGYSVKCPCCGQNSQTSAIVFDNGYIYCRKSLGSCKPLDMANALGIDTRTSFRSPVKSVNPSVVYGKESVGKPTPKLEEVALHGFTAKLCKTIASDSEAPLPFLLIAFLTFAGNLLSGKPYLMLGGYQRSNLYVMTIGQSAWSRKGTSVKEIYDWFEMVSEGFLLIADNESSAEMVGSGFVSEWLKASYSEGSPASGEGVMTELSYSSDNREISVQEPIRWLNVIDEFAQALNIIRREGSTLSEVWRALWDCKEPSTKRSDKANNIRVRNPRLSIIAQGTVPEIKGKLRGFDFTNGFANRFIPIWAHRARPIPFAGEIWREKVKEFIPEFRQIIAFAKDVERMEPDNEVRELYSVWYRSIDDTQQGVVSDLSSRQPNNLMRIAMVYALLDKSATIRREHYEAAKAIIAYSEASVRYIFGDENQVLDADSQKLLDYILENGGVFKDEVHSLVYKKNKRITAAKRDEIYGALENYGLVKKEAINENDKLRELWLPLAMDGDDGMTESTEKQLAETGDSDAMTIEDLKAGIEAIVGKAIYSDNILDSEILYYEKAPFLDISNPLVSDDLSSISFVYDETAFLEIIRNGGKFNFETTHFEYDNEGNSNKVWRFFNQNILASEKLNAGQDNFEECNHYFESLSPNNEPNFLQFYED